MKHNLIAYKVDKLSIEELRKFVKNFIKDSSYCPCSEAWYIMYDVDSKVLTKHLMKVTYESIERADVRLNQLKDEENILKIIDSERMLL